MLIILAGKLAECWITSDRPWNKTQLVELSESPNHQTEGQNLSILKRKDAKLPPNNPGGGDNQALISNPLTGTQPNVSRT